MDSTAHPASKAPIILHHLAPTLTAVCYISAILFSACTLRDDENQRSKNKMRRAVLWSLLGVIFTYAGEAALYVLSGLVSDIWRVPQHLMMYLLSSALVWTCITISIFETQDPPWYTYFGPSAVGTAIEITAFALSADSHSHVVEWSNASILLLIIRIILLSGMLVLGLNSIRNSLTKDAHDEEESQPLIGGDMEVSTSILDNDSRYGSIRSSSKTSGSDDDDGSSQYSSDEDNDEDIKKLQKQRLREQGRWNYFKGFLIFVPYIWPSKDRRMQFWLLAMLFSLVVERFLNVLIPRQLGIITNALTGAAGTRHFPWNELLIWATFHLLSVVVGNDLLKTAANTRINAFCHKQLTSAAFNHVMGLSMDYHTAKSSGELLKSIEQGTEIGQILEAVFFVAGPVLIDLIVAATYLSSVFDSYMALIIITTSLAYVYAGVRCNNIAASRRREYTDAERKANDVMYDAVSNWQTVSYNNRRKFEQNCYLKAVTRYTSAEVSFWDANNYIDTAQSFIMATGLLIACFLAVYRISQGTAPIGNFVLLITYWNLIESPLCNLAYTYRHTSSILISAERLLQVLQTKPSVQDRDDARVLQVAEGRIDFTDVNFSYDPRKTTLKDLSLTVHPGQTIALVGQTGGGKSTTLKLLYRFYDVTSGSVKIDGQDIRDVTLESLRDAFGVVPQDPSLFNRSIMENLRYSRLSATDEEVHAACKAAAIHDKIVSFPEGYGSKVGERGVRLSGGELQRIAIARVILKDPRIVLLDEATSAVDSSTEAQIQSAFRRLSSGRTTFVIAHRLSTVVNADMILVVDNGEVVERGSHLDLLRKKGRYAQLWSKQIFEAAEVDPGAESH